MGLKMEVNPYSLKDVTSLNEPAPTWRFKVSLPYLANTNPVALSSLLDGSLFSSGFSSIVSGGISDIQNVAPKKPINVHISGIDLPQLAVQSVPRYYMGRAQNFPGRPVVDAFTMRFYEDSEYSVTEYLTTWFNNIYNSSGNYGVPYGVFGYKKRLIVYGFDTVGKTISSWELLGVYPERPDGYNFDSESTDRLKITCTFNCDYVNYMGKIGSISSNELGF